MVCGGYAYYLTHTIFETFTNNGREVRSPSTVSRKNLSSSARLFGQRVFRINKLEDYNFWLYQRDGHLLTKNLHKAKWHLGLNQQNALNLQ